MEVEIVKTSVRLERDVLEEFQEAVRDNYDKLKGGQNEALREAVLLWLAHRVDAHVLIMSDNRSGKMEVFRAGEVGERLRAALLARKRPNVSIWRAGINRKFLPGVITEVLRALVEVYGEPEGAKIVRREDDDVLEDLSGPVEGWEDSFWGAEDRYREEVAMRASWQKVSAFVCPDFISVSATGLAFESWGASRTRSPTKPRGRGGEGPRP